MKTAENEMMARLEELWADLPDMPQDIPCEPENAAYTRRSSDLRLAYQTGFPTRYTAIWSHPEANDWVKLYEKALAEVKDGGLLAITGSRGTGKTRLAAEVARAFSRKNSQYETAMGLFLKIRDSYNNKKAASELEIVTDLSKCELLVIDEIQERGNTEWEDRLLNHIIDKRYGNMKPTILIANLTKNELAAALGSSIVSRMNETGGMIEMTGKSHRTKK